MFKLEAQQVYEKKSHASVVCNAKNPKGPGSYIVHIWAQKQIYTYIYRERERERARYIYIYSMTLHEPFCNYQELQELAWP